MSIFYVTNKKPLSHNRNGSNERYKNEFRDEFNNKYSMLYENLPIEKDKLQSSIVYIHQLRPGNIPDVDNLSKPIVDTFTNIMYKDDSQIIKRTATILELKDFDFITVDATNMPNEIYEDFNTYRENGEKNIILFEVNKVTLSAITIGEF